MSDSTYDYDFAFSFAGDQRSEARQLANILENANVRVFFDEFEEAKLFGKDGGEYFAEIYLKRARFCVIFVSRAYGNKMWPIHERRHAVARAIASSTEYILPIRFDDTEIPGVPPTVIHINWKDAQHAANILFEKLATTDGAASARGWSGHSVKFDSPSGPTFKNVNRYSSFNILVLGKAGVGKSSLINYLFGKEIRQPGVGHSVTPLGFHKESTIIDGVPVTIVDTGGLDIASLEKWKSLLDRELEARGSDAPAEKWFHTVIYCISAGGERIDAFETDLIRDLVSKKQRVLVVLSKADQVRRETVSKLRDTLLQDVGEKLACVPVCSTEWERFDGSKVQQFGLRELVNEIVASFWVSIRLRLPHRCIHLLLEVVDDWEQEQKKWIDDNVGYFNKMRGVEHINGKFETFLYKLTREILPRMVTEEVQRTINMFGAIARMFRLTLSSAAPDIRADFDNIKSIGSDDLMGFFAEIFLNVAMFPLSLIAVFRGSFNRFELEEAVGRVCGEVKKKLADLEPDIAVLIGHLVEGAR